MNLCESTVKRNKASLQIVYPIFFTEFSQCRERQKVRHPVTPGPMTVTDLRSLGHVTADLAPYQTGDSAATTASETRHDLWIGSEISRGEAGHFQRAALEYFRRKERRHLRSDRTRRGR